ncbi:MAG: hypothetical protein CL957_04855 [Euryarchaeota archaeon]|nr:hypothetical protein [Euryarchaeota archaeon]
MNDLNNMVSGPKTISEPHKEIRFTRGAQASFFAILAAASGGSSIFLLIFSLNTGTTPLASLWALAPASISLIFFRLSLRCIRHAYLIMTPIGIEIFPFFKPQDNLRVIYWSEISQVEIDQTNRLLIHLSGEPPSGIIASLKPLLPRQRDLLAEAIGGRMSQGAAKRE